MNFIYQKALEKLWNIVSAKICHIFFNDNRVAMIGTLSTLGIVGCVCTVYFMTNPSDEVVHFVRTIFQWLGWW